MVKKSVSKRLYCIECKKQISMKKENGAYVLIGTYNRPSKPDHEGYYHFPCFVDWYNSKVQEKAFGLANTQNEMIKMINDPKLQKLVENVLEGSDLNALIKGMQNLNPKKVSSPKGKKRHDDIKTKKGSKTRTQNKLQ